MTDPLASDAHYLTIDPGEKNVGWASFNIDGKTLGFGIIKGMDEFMDWLEDGPEPKEIVFEGYRLLPGRNRNFSKVRTIELIGLIKRYCHKRPDIKLTEQRNTDLGIGLRYIGMYSTYYQGRKNIKHVDDGISALAHGEYYLVKNKIKKHRLEA